MKRILNLFLIALFILILAMTQTTAFGAGVSVLTKTPMEKMAIRLRHQVAQIQRETRIGELTNDQAKSLKAQVEAIRKQEITFLKQNGTKTLTDDQVNQLNQQLNTLSKSIPIR